MTDTTDKALDALIARYKQVASTMRKMKAASIEAHEIDAGADTITALRARLSLYEGSTGPVSVSGIVQDMEGTLTALRAQLATPSAPSSATEG